MPDDSAGVNAVPQMLHPSGEVPIRCNWPTLGSLLRDLSQIPGAVGLVRRVHHAARTHAREVDEWPLIPIGAAGPVRVEVPGEPKRVLRAARRLAKRPRTSGAPTALPRHR